MQFRCARNLSDILFQIFRCVYRERILQIDRYVAEIPTNDKVGCLF